MKCRKGRFARIARIAFRCEAWATLYAEASVAWERRSQCRTQTCRNLSRRATHWAARAAKYHAILEGSNV